MNFYVFRNNCKSLVVPIDISIFIIDHILFFFTLQLESIREEH